MILNWGICGTGKIGSDFVNALATLPIDRHKILAVASNNEQRAKDFAEMHQIPGFYAGYGNLFADKNINIVYISAVNNQHEEAVISALDAGKHVLCEKPLGVNAKQTGRMIQKAKEKGLFLMEGYWTRFFPAMMKLREEVQLGVIGEPQVFNGCFGFEGVGNVRLLEYGGGAMTSLGAYLPMIASYAFFSNSEPEKPLKVLATANRGSDGSDETVAVTLHYSMGRIANFLASTVMFLPNNGYIVGTKGTITIPEHIWCPTTITSPSGTYGYLLPETNRMFNYVNCSGFQYEAEHVWDCVQKGLKQSPIMPHKETLILAEINDEIRRQVGVIYPQD